MGCRHEGGVNRVKAGCCAARVRALQQTSEPTRLGLDRVTLPLSNPLAGPCGCCTNYV